MSTTLWLRGSIVVACAAVTLAVALGPGPIPGAVHAAPATDVGSSTFGWRNLSSEVRPPARSFAAMAYDAERDRAVLFGGYTGEQEHGIFGGTWEFDGRTWRKFDPDGTEHPGRRTQAAMAYDAARNETVLFGGVPDFSGTFLSDTWVFDAHGWVRQSPRESPPGNAEGELVYDPVREELVLFGGISPSGYERRTWVWNDGTWEERHPEVVPPGREAFSMAFHRARGEVIIFGGSDDGTLLGDTWAWDGTNWRELPKAGGPGALRGTSMASFGRRVLLFGGSRIGGYSDESWVLRARGWQQLDLKKTPGPRLGASLVYDSQRDRAVIFGGFNFEDGGAVHKDSTWALRR